MSAPSPKPPSTEGTGPSKPSTTTFPDQPHTRGYTYPEFLKELVKPAPQNFRINEYTLGYFNNEYRQKINLTLKPRGPFGKKGRPIKVAINSHKVEAWPNKDVFQYDVSSDHCYGFVNC